MRLVSGKHVSHAHVAGDYEREVQDVLHRHISEHDICYDVGASIGYMSLLMAKFGAFVYAFRPAPHAAEQIRLQLSANDLDNYEITQAPVSSDVRRVRFCVTDVAYGSAINETETRWPVLELETTTLDLFAQANRPPDFIKIDAEGEETRVLRGAENLLTTKRPIICCELHDEAVARQVLEILSGHDYAVDSIDGNSIDPGERAESGPFHIVAMPR